MRFKQYAAPLQAFFALFFCAGMAWMVFVMAAFNPAPPSRVDLQLRSTQDMSFVSMNSTAAALALEMVSEYMPTPIVLQVPVTGATHTATPSPAITFTPGAFYTAPPSLTPSSFFSFLFPPTATRERIVRTPTPTWTLTVRPTVTTTLTPTPTWTLTVKPTATKTLTPTPTEVPSLPTEPPTATLYPSATPTDTAAPPPTASETAMPTDDPSPPPPIDTVTPDPSATPIPSP